MQRASNLFVVVATFLFFFFTALAQEDMASKAQSSVVRYFVALGRVQNVMFRQTLIRAAQRRGLQAGATNTPENKNQVSFTLQGPTTEIDQIVEFMKSGKPLNSWGAVVKELRELETGLDWDRHEVTTKNVDSFKWKSGVEFFI